MMNLNTENIRDIDTRQGFVLVQELWNSDPILNFKWKFFTFTFTEGGTFNYPHQLGFQPKDWIKTGILNSVTPGSDFYIDLDECDATNMSIVVGGACTVRFLIGNLDVASSA